MPARTVDQGGRGVMRRRHRAQGGIRGWGA